MKGSLVWDLNLKMLQEVGIEPALPAWFCRRLFMFSRVMHSFKIFFSLRSFLMRLLRGVVLYRSTDGSGVTRCYLGCAHFSGIFDFWIRLKTNFSCPPESISKKVHMQENFQFTSIASVFSVTLPVLFIRSLVSP